METYESVKSNPVQPEQKEKKKGGAWKGIVAVILAAVSYTHLRAHET